MSDILRYDLSSYYDDDGNEIHAMESTPFGDYVTYEDHLQEIEKYKERIKELGFQLELLGGND